MQKKPIVLAIASAFAAPVAMAASSNVDIKGQMNVSFDSLKGKDSVHGTNKSQLDVSSNASFIEFLGNEDLGGGIKAVWDLKTYVSLGGTGTSDTGVITDSFVNGPAYAGLSSSSLGTVLLGKMEGPYKVIGRKVDLFGNTLGDIRNFSLGFDTRPNNTIAYASPDMSGFQVTAAYITNMTYCKSSGCVGSLGTNVGVLGVSTSGATNKESVNGYSAAATYTNGPLFVGLGYEKHNTSRPDTKVGTFAATAEDEKAWRLVGGYTFGDFKVTGMYEDGSDLGGTAGNDRKVYGVGGAYKMGANTIKAQFYKAGELAGVNDTDANMWSLALDHSMSKRTTVYAGYARTNNQSKAKFSAFGGGHGDNPGSATGKDPSGFTLGMIHNF